MDINQIKSEGLIRIFEANIPKDYILQKESEELQKIAKKVNLNGFRKGKAPLDIIKKNYEQSILVKVFNNLTNDLLLQIFKKFKVTPITDPKIDISKGDITKREDVTLTLELEVYPDIPNIDLSAITLNKVKLEVSEEDINKFLEKLSQHYFEYKDLDENRPLQMGDIVSIDFVGKIDDKEFEGGSAKNFNLELGSKAFIDGFEEQLVGAKPNEEVTVSVVFPPEYKFKQEYSNKKAVFNVKINGLKQKVNSAIEDLPKKLNIPSLDDLKKDIKERHLRQYDLVLKNDLKNQLINLMLDLVDFELPCNLLEREKQIMLKDFEKYKELKAAGNTEPNPSYDNKSEEEILKDQEDAAKKRIKLSLIFNSIAETNNIHVLPTEIDNFIKQEAVKYGSKEKEVINSYKNNKNVINNIKNLILEDKILSYIFANVKYNEKNMSLSEYNNSIQENHNKI